MFGHLPGMGKDCVDTNDIIVAAERADASSSVVEMNQPAVPTRVQKPGFFKKPGFSHEKTVTRGFPC